MVSHLKRAAIRAPDFLTLDLHAENLGQVLQRLVAAVLFDLDGDDVVAFLVGDARLFDFGDRPR